MFRDTSNSNAAMRTLGTTVQGRKVVASACPVMACDATGFDLMDMQSFGQSLDIPHASTEART